MKVYMNETDMAVSPARQIGSRYLVVTPALLLVEHHHFDLLHEVSAWSTAGYSNSL